MRRIAIVLVYLTLAACSGGGSATEVKMTEGQLFKPDEMKVAVGDTVTWTNDSSEAHTVTAYEEEVPEGGEYFASGDAASEDEAREDVEDGLLGEGDTFEATFEVPGTYTYFCIPHEAQGMVATVVVEG